MRFADARWGGVLRATKAAVKAIRVSLAAELGPRKIRVNAVAPESLNEDQKRQIIDQLDAGS
ncbi:MAG: hypothetical protein B7Z58_13970 [Acidiphilium sp. 37-64-53]|nr:MAG: hypothetical protein B7Z58_13970 [Acidiphilium sp. 37-64-53]